MSQQLAVCYRCHRPLHDANARFCDGCGFPQDSSHVYQARSELQKTVDSLTATVESLKDEKSQLKNQLDELKEFIAQAKLIPQGALTLLESGKQTLTGTIQSIEDKRNALETEIQTLTDKRNRIAEKMGASEQSEESEEQIVKKSATSQKARKVQRRIQKPVREKAEKPTGAGHYESHTFIYKYQGKGDWQNELTDFARQHAITLRLGDIAATPERIVFSAKGTRNNLVKFISALEKADFANLRLRFALSKKNLTELEIAIEKDKKALATLTGNMTALNRLPRHRTIFERGLGKRKKELAKGINEVTNRLNENTRKYTEAQQTMREAESIIKSADLQFPSLQEAT